MLIQLMEKAKIMIVEDDIIIQDDLETTLVELGYDVVATAVAADEAINKAGAEKPDLILMDVNLEGESDGIDAAKIIKERFDIPIIFLTAFSDDSKIERAKVVMPYRYLTKPVQDNDLRISLEMALYAGKINAKRKLAEARFRDLVESSSDWIWEVDRNGVYTYVSPKVYDLLGYKPEEIIGTSLFDLMPPEEASRSEAVFNAFVETRMPFNNLENIHHHKSGKLVVLETNGVPIIEKDGTLAGYRGIDRDISERKQTEKALKQAKLEAEKANRAKSQFLANMSHELRTPLNAIIGFTQVLAGQLQDVLKGKQFEYFNYIKESGNHLLEMVNDILDLSKIEAEKINLDIQPFDFLSMLKRAPSLISHLAGDKKIGVEVDISNDIGWFSGDETRLKQVLFNLLSNAIKFTEPNRKVGIEARQADGKIEVVVWDEGEGIPETYLGKIFDPFEQVKKNDQTNTTGTGLGLSISKRLIELHGGTLSVVSQVGKGSRFAIQLPGTSNMANSPVSEDTKPMESTEPLALKDMRILVAEDNESNRMLIDATLQPEGCLLEYALTGEEAVQLATEKSYDLILMDIQMPGIDGTEAMRKIRETPRGKTPIIALTAFAMKGDEEKYLKAGFDDYLSKPLNISRLIRKIHRFAATP